MKREALYGRISPAWLPGKGIGGPAAEKLKTGGNPLLMARGKEEADRGKKRIS